MKKFLLFGLVLVLGFSACATHAPVTAVPPSLVADLTEKQGTVWARLPSESEFAAANPILTLPVSSQVQTGEDGLARLDFSTGTILRLSPNTLFILQENQEQDQGLWTRIQLKAGEVWVILRGGELEIETPAGISAVRGSYMSTAFDSASGGTRVTCLEGHCQVQNESGVATLTDGEAAVLPADGGAPIKGKMTPEDYARWREFNPEAETVLPAPTATLVPTLPPTPTSTPTEVVLTCEIDTNLEDGKVYLRACGGLECAVVGYAQDGEVLQQDVTAEATENWLPVLWEGQTVWVNRAFCH